MNHFNYRKNKFEPSFEWLFVILLFLFFSSGFCRMSNKILHLHDPGTFLCMNVRCGRAQNLVLLQLQFRWHCKHLASKYWSQHSTHKSHSNIGRVKWFHPFFVPTCFNWCWIEHLPLLLSLLSSYFSVFDKEAIIQL